jgi:type II restriction enzyme
MSKKSDLRRKRFGTVINISSRKQESRLGIALTEVIRITQAEFHLRLMHERDWKVAAIIDRLRIQFPDTPFAITLPNSAMRPDGGILSIEDVNGDYHPILIVEVKNQGTNDLLRAEGKPQQARGNAIERLGKNVIGFRTALISEGIMPFVCFGDGDDFSDISSIRDRVVTIAMFGPLNEIVVVNQGETGQFNRGSFFFRETAWTSEEMTNIMVEVAHRSIHYYFAKHGETFFQQLDVGQEGASILDVAEPDEYKDDDLNLAEESIEPNDPDSSPES